MAPTELSTDRLWLRPYLLHMALPFWQLLEQNRERLAVDFPDRTSAVRSLEEAEKRIQLLSYQRRIGDMYSFGIWRKDTDAYIGDITLRRIARGKLFCEVGYYIAAEAEGQGYITESLQALLKFAFDVLRMESVNLRCAIDNYRSQAVAERCGFTRTRQFTPEVISSDGPPRPIYQYRLLNKDYRQMYQE